MGANAELQKVLEKISRCILDARTKEYAIKDALLRCERGQKLELITIGKELESITVDDRKSIQQILKRHYYNYSYEGFPYVKYFKENKVNDWLSESYMHTLKKDRARLEHKIRAKKQIDQIEFPQKERKIPSTLQILKSTRSTIPEGMKIGFIDVEFDPLELSALTKESESIKEIKSLNIELPDKTVEHQKLTIMLRHVLKLHQFLANTKFLHSRKLASTIAIEPVSLLGEPVKENIRLNFVKKKLKYLRRLITSLPPISKDDSDYLTSLVENPDAFEVKGEFSSLIRREYKRFLKKTYTVDQNFDNFEMNKYAYAHPHDVDNKYIKVDDEQL